MNSTARRSPWAWIPALYVAEGIPSFVVNSFTVIIYTQMGISLTDMAFYTGWLYLPWVIKPFWSPFVDIFKTKRAWIVSMQLLLGVAMAAVAFMLPAPFFFTGTLAVFWIMAFLSATHDIAADGYYMLALTQHQQAAFVGVRNTFYRLASLFGQGGLVMWAGYMQQKGMAVSSSWSMVFVALSVLFLCITLYDWLILPHSPNDKPMPGVTARSIVRNFCMTFVSFFRKPHIVTALCFMLLYRLPEALCLKLTQPFLLAPRAEGGLGLTTIQLGLVNVWVGVLALLAGGILGGVAIARGGFRKWLWPMALSLTLPCIFYCFLAMFQPQNFVLICLAIGIEQFGYGFGYTAFMMYLIYFSKGPSETSHFSFCTAFAFMGLMVPGMFAGWIHDTLSRYSFFGLDGPQGYVNFFWWVMICCIATFAVCLKIKVNPNFGKKQAD